MLIRHILLFKLKDRKAAQSVAALGRPHGLKFSLIFIGFWRNYGKIWGRHLPCASKMLNPPLVTPDFKPSAADGAKNLKNCRTSM